MNRTMTLITALALFAGVAVSAEDPGALARRLADLRAEVEQLHADLEAERDGVKSAARNFETTRTELAAQVRDQQSRAEELSRTLARLQSEAAQRNDAHVAFLPVIAPAIEALMKPIDAGIPFRQDDRKKTLTQIQEQVTAGVLDPRAAITRLWQHVEDELRLTRENTLDRVTIEVDGQTRNVQVARLGTVAMFYMAPDGATGRLVRDGATWTWRTVTDLEEQELITHLFEAFDKQGRTGWYELPWALGGVEP